MTKVDVDPNTPLLWVIRDHLQLTGTKFGCGMAQCGACTVHLDGRAIRSCMTPVSMASGKQVTTIEGLAETDAGKNGTGCLAGSGRTAVRILPIRSNHVGYRAAQGKSAPQRIADIGRDGWQPVPLRYLQQYPRGDPEGIGAVGRCKMKTMTIQNPSRRKFLKDSALIDGRTGDRLLPAAERRSGFCRRRTCQASQADIPAQRIHPHRSRRQHHDSRQ